MTSSGLLFDLLLLAASLPPALAVAYAANFQRTVLLVSRKLVPEETVFIPPDLKRDITPRRLLLWNYAALASLCLLMVAAWTYGLLILLLPVLLFLGAGSPLVVAFTLVRPAGSKKFMDRIVEDLRRKCRESSLETRTGPGSSAHCSKKSATSDWSRKLIFNG